MASFYVFSIREGYKIIITHEIFPVNDHKRSADHFITSTVFSVQCIMYFVQWIMYFVQCINYNVHCAMYIQRKYRKSTKFCS